DSSEASALRRGSRRPRSPPALPPPLLPPGRLDIGVIKVAILVVSSKIAEGREEDKGKKPLGELVESIPAVLLSYEVVPDDAAPIRERLKSLTEAGVADVVLTVGGTGVRPTDIVPEITREVADKEIAGIGYARRVEGWKKG